MTNWDALATAAAASRRLNRCLAETRLRDEETNEIATALDELADKFVAGSQRDKFDDMMTRPHLAAIYSGKHTPLDLSREMKLSSIRSLLLAGSSILPLLV